MSKKILTLSLILLALSLVSKSEVQARTSPRFNLGKKDITVSKNEVVSGPYLRVGNNITINGTINGDAYLLGNFITINGRINGDLIAAGGVVTVKGDVSDDIRSAGGLIVIDSKVGKNVTALGGTITLGSDTDIDGDLLAAGGRLVHLGNIDGNVLAYTNEATLGGRVGGDTTTQSHKIKVLKTALLGGNLFYKSNREASISARAKIGGVVKRTPAGKALTRITPRARRLFSRFHILSYLSALFLGVVLLKVAPRQATAVSKMMEKRPWKSLGLGFLALVLTPMAVLVLLITIIGAPLAAIIGGLYLLAISLSPIFGGLLVGQKIFDLANLKENIYAMLAVGLLLLQLLFALPAVGLFFRLLNILVAVGAIITLRWEALERSEVRSE